MKPRRRADLLKNSKNWKNSDFDLSIHPSSNSGALNPIPRSKMTYDQDLDTLPSNQASKNYFWGCLSHLSASSMWYFKMLFLFEDHDPKDSE